jgi:hypothetical protein
MMLVLTTPKRFSRLDRHVIRCPRNSLGNNSQSNGPVVPQVQEPISVFLRFDSVHSRLVHSRASSLTSTSQGSRRFDAFDL